MAIAAAFVVSAGLYFIAGGQSEAGTPVEGVPIDRLAADGFLVELAPESTMPAIGYDRALELAMKDRKDVKVLEAALVTFRSEEGLFTEERLVWAISFDPKTVPVPLIHGSHNTDPKLRENAEHLVYIVEFWDATIGEFLLGANQIN